MSVNKYEKLIELIINEDQKKARALFHEIVIDNSRTIYESLKEEDELGQDLDGDDFADDISDHEDDIENDEAGESEFDDEGEDLGADEDLESEEGEEIEDRVLDLEDAIDELKAEFDSLMADEEGEDLELDSEDDLDSEVDLDSEDDLDSEELDSEDELDDEDSELDSDEELDDESEEDEKSDGIYEQRRKSPSDLMREYVEKVSAVNAKSEGEFVGTGSESGAKPTVNKRSSQIGGKNDFGGTSANIARGGSEASPDGSSPKKASNAYTKGETKMGRDSYANTAGGRGAKLEKVSKVSAKETDTNKTSVIESKRRTTKARK
jgi:hypothetical protein